MSFEQLIHKYGLPHFLKYLQIKNFISQLISTEKNPPSTMENTTVNYHHQPRPFSHARHSGSFFIFVPNFSV